MTVKYRTNGSSSNNSMVGTFPIATTNVVTREFTPQTKSNAKSLHSLQIIFNDAESNIPMNFELHDISIVYRERKVK